MIEQKSTDRPYPGSSIPDNLPAQKKQLLKKLLYIFIFFSSKSSKHSYSQLPQHYYLQLLSSILQSKGSKPLQKSKPEYKDLQLLYYTKGKKNSLNFQNFLELLPMISIYIEPDLSKEDALKSLMHHMSNVYDEVVKGEIEGKVVGVQTVIEDETREFLGKLSGDILELYKVYFTNQVNSKTKSKTMHQQSFSNYLEFLKDFQIFPKLIPARDLFYIFNQQCQSPPSSLLYHSQSSSSPPLPEQGILFTFSKFIESLLILSKRAFPKLKQVQNEQQWETQQKYVLRTLFEYMETAKSMGKKNAKFMTKRFCFIVLEEHPKEMMMKSIQVGDRIIKEPKEQMGFMGMMRNLTL